MCNQKWFEMGDIQKKSYKASVWIPLRACGAIEKQGEQGFDGYREEFFGCGTVAIPTENKNKAKEVGWQEVGINHNQSIWFQGEQYIPAEEYLYYKNGVSGIHLVLEQSFDGREPNEWHLNQDFVIALGLKREGDIWVSPGEGYTEVARLKRDEKGRPILLEVRAEFLKDYLCARKMSLLITSYFSRDAIFKDASFIKWKKQNNQKESGSTRWEGRIFYIHEGGFPFGEGMSVMHVGRTDIDNEEDIPVISPNDSMKTKSWTKKYKGGKLTRVMGEVWRREWLDSAKLSPRVKGDMLAPTVFFITDEKGTRENKDSLPNSGKWLWFKPEVITALINRRGGNLSWYTKNTGSVGCSPNDDVHFGINKLGLVNVYAKDIGLLPDWQQQIWAGYNISPEGGVSSELLDSQAKGIPAKTQAPEQFLGAGIENINKLTKRRFGVELFRMHNEVPEVLKKTHRFRATDKAGLYALAKDIARLTADDLDSAAIQQIISNNNGEKLGSIKLLEKLIASKLGEERARLITAPLVGAYDLRLGDAHLPKKDIEDAFSLLRISSDEPFIIQGYQLLNACASSLWTIVKVLEEWDSISTEEEKGTSPKS